MQEFFAIMAAVSAVIAFLLGFTIGGLRMNDKYIDDMKSVGIEKIVRCNNVQSNWCEIVWIKK